MTDAALLELLRRELPRLVRQAVRDELQRDTLTPMQRAVFVIVVKLYKAGEVITSSSMLDAARFDPDAPAVLRQACGNDSQKLGILLGQIADSGALADGMRLVRLPREAGVRRWALEALEPLRARAPCPAPSPA